MSKEGSVAPKERINITYVPATGDQQAEVELPLKTMVIGDFKGHGEETQLEDREAVSIDKTTFNSVMSESNLPLETAVTNRLSDDDEQSDLSIKLKFSTLDDFSPDSIASQVPELKSLIDLREALVSLKGPLGNVPEFRKRMQELLASEEDREALLSELELLNKDN
jgi:type VI secretion system protein ImpB